MTVGARIASVLLVLGTTKFFTSFLSEADFGTLSLYAITSTLPAMFFFGPLGQGIIRYVAVAQEKKEFAQFHSEYQATFLSGSIAVSFVGAIISLTLFLTGNQRWGTVIALITPLAVASTYNAYCIGLQNYAEKRFLAIALETCERLAQQAFAVFLLWRVSPNPHWVFVGQLAASILFLWVNHCYFRKTFPEIGQVSITTRLFSFHGEYQKAILHYAWPFIIFGAAFWFQSSSERWALDLYQNKEVVAHYAVINQLGFQSLSLIFGSIAFFVSPLLFRRAGSLGTGQFENANRLNDMFLLFNVGLTASVAIVFWAFDKQIVRTLTSSKYESVAAYLPWMVLAGGLFNFAQIYSNRFMVALHSRGLLLPKLVAAFAGITLNLIAARSRSLEWMIGAVFLTNATYVVAQIFSWKRFTLRVPLAKPQKDRQ